jgi:hypothetical protein
VVREDAFVVVVSHEVLALTTQRAPDLTLQVSNEALAAKSVVPTRETDSRVRRNALEADAAGIHERIVVVHKSRHDECGK